MTVRMKVVFNHFPEIAEQWHAQLGQAVKETAAAVETDIKLEMHKQKGGRAYLRSGGRVHKASAPGEAPAIDYGHLINSIQVDNPSDLQAVVYTNADYAAHLEYGTVHMAARPFMTPAALRAWDDFQARAKRILESAK